MLPQDWNGIDGTILADSRDLWLDAVSLATVDASDELRFNLPPGSAGTVENRFPLGPRDSITKTGCTFVFKA